MLRSPHLLVLALFTLACEGEKLTQAPGDAGSDVPRTDDDGGPAACPSGRTLSSGESSPFHIVVANESIYWTSTLGIFSTSISGGAPQKVSSLQSVRAIAAHDHTLFVADYDAFVIRRIVDGQSTVFANANASDLAVAGGHLYWTQQSEDNVIHMGEGIIARAPLGGGDVEVLATGLACPQALAVNASAAFFSMPCSHPTSDAGNAPATVARWSFGSASLDSVYEGSAGDIAARDDGGYFVTADTWPNALMHAPNVGQADAIVAELPAAGTVAVDDTGVFVGTETGRILHLPHGAGEPTTLATSLGAPHGIGRMALSSAAVFATLPGAGEVVCIPKQPGDTEPTFDGPCPTPIGDPQAVSASPRVDEEMELLALRLDGTVAATQATYERLVADRSAIQSVIPAVTVQYRAPNDGKSLLLLATEEAAHAIQADAYGAWDCLGDFYGVEDVGVEHSDFTDDWRVNVRLAGRYDVERLAEVYVELPGVYDAMPAMATAGDGPTLCVRRTANAYEYVVDDRRGDCPAGCTETSAYYFASDSAGVVELVDSWEGGGMQAAPGWYAICSGF